MIRYLRLIEEPWNLRVGCAGLALAFGALLSTCQAFAQPAIINPQTATFARKPSTSLRKSPAADSTACEAASTVSALSLIHI